MTVNSEALILIVYSCSIFFSLSLTYVSWQLIFVFDFSMCPVREEVTVVLIIPFVQSKAPPELQNSASLS
jgi:hypothetical protein